MNYVISKNISLKNQRFTQSGCKDTEIYKFEFDFYLFFKTSTDTQSVRYYDDNFV